MDIASISEKRVKLENPKLFFDAIKKSPKYVSWKELVESISCGNTSLKSARRGKRTLHGKNFLKLLNYLTEPEREIFLSKANFLDGNWGAQRGGKKSIESRKYLLGAEGFREYMEHVRSFNEKFTSLSEWHQKMKTENPEEYSRIQRKRWLSMKSKYKDKKIDVNRGKAVQTIYSRYGVNFFQKLGLGAAERKELNERELQIKKITEDLCPSIRIVSHKTIDFFNVDFLYEGHSGPTCVEEVLGFKKNKSKIFYDILIIKEKFSELSKNFPAIGFLLTSWREKKLQYKKERFPIDVFLWSLENRMLPVFVDIPELNQIRVQIISGIVPDKNIVRQHLEKLLLGRSRLVQGAKSQLNQNFNGLEELVHKKLMERGFNPEGKKMLETKFGTYIVTDNFFQNGSQKIAVFVSSSYCENIIGSAALVKELVDNNIKIVGILESDVKLKSSYRKVKEKLLKKYVDFFFSSLQEFDDWALSSAW